jgi:pimeloyl-ACP methyl ester carboxylesterase
MSKGLRLILAIVVCVSLLPVGAAAAQSTPIPNCVPFPIDPANPTTSEVYLICQPTAWNGDLVMFAHGYVAINEPMTGFLSELVLSDGSTIPDLTNGLGFGFATTSYRKNGLAVKEGVQDVARLLAFYTANFGAPHHVYLIGASEGGLVTTLAVEQHPDLYTGGLAMCGPIGNFNQQINYWGDFRVLFDYFFPTNVIPNTAVDINEALVWPNWVPTTTLTIAQAVTANPAATQQLLTTSRAPIDTADPASVLSTTLGILNYNVFATNEGKVELGGQPYDNWYKWYFGSTNDFALNRGVARFRADRAALTEINNYYQTSGKLKSPLVTLHTTGDPIVPYWHETLYTLKTALKGSLLKRINIPIVRYGHCNFKSSEALAAFAILVLRSGGLSLTNVAKVLPDAAVRADYDKLVNQYLTGKLPKAR